LRNFSLSEFRELLIRKPAASSSESTTLGRKLEKPPQRLLRRLQLVGFVGD